MKKKRIKIKKILILMVFIGVLVLFFMWYKDLRIKNIYVKGNHLLTEQEIIDLAGLRDYPKMVEIKENKIKKDLESLPLINKVEISSSLFGKIIITIEENVPVYRDISGKIMLSSGEMIDNNDDISVPILINDVDIQVQDKFIKQMMKVNDSIIIRISEIEYSPTEIDKERFLFYMTDGNNVYITLSKMEHINTYNEIYPTLEGQKGILYLDSGNHFEIKK